MKNLIIFLVLFTATFSVFSQQSQPSFFFTENNGQIIDDKGITHSEILFTGQGEDYSIYLRKTGWSYILKSYDSNSYQTKRVDIDFENSNPEFKIETYNKLPGYDNFPVRNNEEITHVYSFSEVVYKDVYNGIDLRFYYDKGNLRYDYIVHPKADPNQITMAIKYADNPTINPENGINIPTLLGEIRKEKPFAYQADSIQKIEIPCNYKLTDNKISFITEKYDNSKELVIDPVSLVWGKIRNMKSMFKYFQGIQNHERSYYSWSLANKNIKRLKDNSVILLSNNILDYDFSEESYTKIPISKTLLLPTIITKYDSLNNKEWSVYLYEKHNNVISWDANDSMIVVYAQSYFYLDSTAKEYNKDAVFVSVFDMKGNLLRRFELTKPEGIVHFIHPQQDDNLFHGDWTYSMSYEKTLKLINNQISLIAIGRYSDMNDSTYDCALFLQTYSLDGNMSFNKKLKHNIIKRINGNIICDSSSFCNGVIAEFSLIRFLENGSIFIARNDTIQTNFEFYDKQGNFDYKISDENDYILFQKQYNLAFKIDENKNFFVIVHCDSNDALIIKYKSIMIKNPYTPNYKKRQPYLLKFDSTGKLLWLTQILSFPENYTITSGVDYISTPPISLYDMNIYREDNYLTNSSLWASNYRTPMNIGSDIVMSFDSVGNIFIPRIIDTLEHKVQSSSRKLVIIKISPEGDLLWQDTSALHFNFDYGPWSFRSSVMRIKNATIVGNSLYLDYFVSNLDGMTPAKDNAKFDLKEIYPIPDITYLVGDKAYEQPENNQDMVFEMLFLKFNLNESDLVEFKDENLKPIDNIKFDTVCVGQTSTFKFKVTNKWHSKMTFEIPVIEGDGYSITPSGKFSISPNESKEFTILFSPIELKTYDAKIIFKQNDIANFSSTLYLKGFTKATFLKSDSVWNLGTILINNTASNKFKLYNNGNIGTWFWGIRGLPSEFKQILPADSSGFLKAFDSLEFTIEFTPTKVGIFEYKYKFVAGTGCPDTCEITIRGRGVTESIELSSDSLDYGYLYSCETKTDTLFIENVANNPVTYNSADLIGLNPDNFIIVDKPTDGTIMLRGNPLKFIVQFKPSGVYGIKQADLQIKTSEKTINCPLTGEYSEIKISANDIEMGYKSINVAYDTTIKIINNTKDKFTLEQVIPEDNRITVTTALPLEIPTMESKDLAIQINSSTKEPLNSKIKLTFSGRCTAELNANINCKFDSASAEIASIDFGKVPYCEDRIDNISIKNTSKTLFKVIKIEFSENDGRFEFTDNDTYPLEIQAGNTYKKAIRYLAGAKQVSNNQAKVLITMEMNGKEQTFEILIKGERVIPDLSYQNLINLGQSKPSEIKTNDIEIINNGENINITDVKIIDNTNFQVKDYPKIINKNAKGNINISFNSDNIGNYTTDMTVYFKLGECIDSLKININAEVKRLMTIWANHDTVDAGNMGYHVPIYAKTDLGANINGSNYSLNVKYLPEIYNSITSEDAVISATTRDGSYEIVKVEGKFPEFKDTTEILFHLKGNILFSTAKTTPIEIEYLSSEKSLAVTTIAGSLILRPLCINNLRGIQYYKPATLSVTPHPLNESSKINVISQNRGLHVLELYSVAGEKYEIGSWTQSDGEQQIHELTFDKKNFPSGVYLLNLRMEWSNVQEVVVVVE